MEYSVACIEFEACLFFTLHRKDAHTIFLSEKQWNNLTYLQEEICKRREGKKEGSDNMSMFQKEIKQILEESASVK